MKVHEYQAKDLLKAAGVAVPAGIVITSPEEAAAAARGMLGKTLVTYQTGAEGQAISKVLVTVGHDIARELYLGLAVDRDLQCPVLMATTEGGVEIEKVAHETPEKIHREPIDVGLGLADFQARKVCQALDLKGETAKKGVVFLKAFVRLFLDTDASLAEINPLIVTEAGDVLALDCKFNFDDNAMFRHPQLASLLDVAEEDQNELRAGKSGLSYVSLDGNIACLVNGAGLAMSTMDLIKYHSGEPANFLDVGGGASKDQVLE